MQLTTDQSPDHQSLYAQVGPVCVSVEKRIIIAFERSISFENRTFATSYGLSKLATKTGRVHIRS